MALRVSLGLDRVQFAHALGVYVGAVVVVEEEAQCPSWEYASQLVAEKIRLVYGPQRSHLKLIRGGRA